MQHFWPNVGDGSWLLEVNGASHNTFLCASWLVEKALDLLCKRGPTSHEVGATVCRSMMCIKKNLPCSFADFLRDCACRMSAGEPEHDRQANLKGSCAVALPVSGFVAEECGMSKYPMPMQTSLGAQEFPHMWCFACLDPWLTCLHAGYNWFDHASIDCMDGQRVAGCTDGYSGTFIAQYMRSVRALNRCIQLPT